MKSEQESERAKERQPERGRGIRVERGGGGVAIAKRR